MKVTICSGVLCCAVRCAELAQPVLAGQPAHDHHVVLAGGAAATNRDQRADFLRGSHVGTAMHPRWLQLLLLLYIPPFPNTHTAHPCTLPCASRFESLSNTSSALLNAVVIGATNVLWCARPLPAAAAVETAMCCAGIPSPSPGMRPPGSANRPASPAAVLCCCCCCCCWMQHVCWPAVGGQSGAAPAADRGWDADASQPGERVVGIRGVRSLPGQVQAIHVCPPCRPPPPSCWSRASSRAPRFRRGLLSRRSS